jgi:hypothetical protein
MYEHKSKPLISRQQFAQRYAIHIAIAFGVVILALGIGVIGYHCLESLSWVDSLENAAMILGGMGPINTLYTNAGKIFAACYALFSGLVFMIVFGIIAAPALHRLIHRFHLDDEAS